MKNENLKNNKNKNRLRNSEKLITSYSQTMCSKRRRGRRRAHAIATSKRTEMEDWPRIAKGAITEVQIEIWKRS